MTTSKALSYLSPEAQAHALVTELLDDYPGAVVPLEWEARLAAVLRYYMTTANPAAHCCRCTPGCTHMPQYVCDYHTAIPTLRPEWRLVVKGDVLTHQGQHYHATVLRVLTSDIDGTPRTFELVRDDETVDLTTLPYRRREFWVMFAPVELQTRRH